VIRETNFIAKSPIDRGSNFLDFNRLLCFQNCCESNYSQKRV